MSYETARFATEETPPKSCRFVLGESPCGGMDSPDTRKTRHILGKPGNGPKGNEHER